MKLPNKQIPTGALHRAYSAVVTCAIPLIAAGLLFSKRGRRRLSERFGSWGTPFEVGWWFHGASVGEVQGVLPLVSAVHHQTPSEQVLLTATSPTGLERGGRSFNQHRLAPIDAPILVSRAMRSVSFNRFVLSETELWPNLLQAVFKNGAPAHIVNGRISDYTYNRYKYLRAVFAPLLRGFTSVSVADAAQRERFVSLGVAPERVHVTGHTKYDVSPRFAGEQARHEARQSFFPAGPSDLPIVTLGSIREGEEGPWFRALCRIWAEGGQVRVIVAPRHAERFEYFFDRMSSLPVEVARWSTRKGAGAADCRALLLDTMGILERAYAASDLAFIGATLVDIGGHNPFEPAMYGVPVVVGPYTSVIREPVNQLRARQALLDVRTEDDIYDVVRALVSGRTRLSKAGQDGQLVWAAHQGAAQRVLSVILQSEAHV